MPEGIHINLKVNLTLYVSTVCSPNFRSIGESNFGSNFGSNLRSKWVKLSIWADLTLDLGGSNLRSRWV